LTTLVACSTELNTVKAIAKVIRDMAAIRIAFRNPTPPPSNWDDFCNVSHGGLYMAQTEQLPAFQFLLSGSKRRPLSQMPAFAPSEEKDALQWILARLRQCNLDAYAVDLSTDEALRCGIRVVRVIIPALQPLSFHYRARYLGHPRLYDAPAKMGYAVHPEERLNRWPQPFA
jgi:ribosomal protein S12 methylthiotransferase accessory factor